MVPPSEVVNVVEKALAPPSDSDKLYSAVCQGWWRTPFYPEICLGRRRIVPLRVHRRNKVGLFSIKMAVCTKCEDEMTPINIRQHRILDVFHAFHCREEIIIEGVELGRDVPGAEVQDQTNIGGIFRRVTQEFALMFPRIELWNLLAILQGGIKNISWASQNMKSAKM
eukprot:6907798-Ditylum_brightwellii.AAC.1